MAPSSQGPWLYCDLLTLPLAPASEDDSFSLSFHIRPECITARYTIDLFKKALTLKKKKAFLDICTLKYVGFSNLLRINNSNVNLRTMVCQGAILMNSALF